ncbi:hypothetical protein ACFE04_029593 [Oxalis oulophora]
MTLLNCRIWWPKDLTDSTKSYSSSSRSSLLFGWFVSVSSLSLDVVVAFQCYEPSSLSSEIEEIVHNTNAKMPIFLQDKSNFAFLGTCTGNSVQLSRDEMEDTSFNGIASTSKGKNSVNGQWSSRCLLDGLLEKNSNDWILLVYDNREQYGKDVQMVPKLQKIQWNGQIISHSDVHVIVYATPTRSSHHFSLKFEDSSEQEKTHRKKPKWFEELHQKKPLNDLDTVILAINCAAAAKTAFEIQVGPKRSFSKFVIFKRPSIFLWKLVAILTASLCTMYYILLQLFHNLLSFGSESWLYISLARIFSTTWINIRIRCCQILYWPIYLQDHDLRSQSCVEYACKAALLKNSMWSSIAADFLLGNLIGFTLLFYSESVSSWILKFASDTTNELLRSGCVWLMGDPAGFKLNAELASVLGMISLTAIQIWSTLWSFLGFLFCYLIKGLALLGIVFGATVPAALIIDIICVATLHVSIVRLLISILYSQQIQALAFLWRLFRGRKCNPLRQRLDSYDYTVKQHVVGSLLFTPLLLLLPTTSVFYIYFTILKTTIMLVCILIEITISIIHETPYIKIFFWIVRPRKFPSGVWFEIKSHHTDHVHSVDSVKKDTHEKGSCVLVSVLHSNTLSIGQILWPHYRKVFAGISGSFIATSAHAVLTGKPISSTLGTGLPPTMPWMTIPCRDYWHICRNSILGCGSKSN